MNKNWRYKQYIIKTIIEGLSVNKQYFIYSDLFIQISGYN